MRSLIFALTFVLAVPAFAKEKVEPFQLRKFETQTLKNGLKILWLADPSLPYIAMNLMINSGSSQDPAGKEGLAAFTAGMLEKGSTKRSATQISEDLEQIGSGIDVGVEPDYTMVTTSALSFHKDNVLKQFAEVLLQPSFTNAEIERHRKNILGSLQKLADSPEAFTEYLMPRFLFGTHPYGHEAVGRPGSVKNFKRMDLQKFYADNYDPSHSVLAVVGQYDGAWKESVVKTMEAWKAKPSTQVEIPEFPQWKGRELLLVDRGDLNQAQIQIGFKGIPRSLPEYLEFRAALKVLGESFGSRLFEEIRVKRGLTYHISAWFDPRLKPGPMGIYTFTRTDKIAETVEETLKTYKKFVDDGVTDAEVTEVKALMRGQFPRNFETAEALGKQLLILNRYGISPDYLTNYLVNVQAMTKDSVNKSIKKYFDTENLRILVYAPRAKAEESLKKLGKLEIKNYKEFLL
ncbi:MAG: M16 family metallopeptidase [Bdellovibrionales bacterium]